MTEPIYVFTFRGISERLNGNLIDLLPLPDGAIRIEVPWAASYGPVPQPFGLSYHDSLAAGMALGERMVKDVLLDEPFARIVFVGYSGGAALAGDLAAKLGGSLVDAVILIADPNAPGTSSVFGIVRRRETGLATYWLSNPNDGICSCPRYNPLRIIARTTPCIALDRRSWGAQGADVWRQLNDPATRRTMAAEIGPPWSPVTWHRWERAFQLADGYLSQREHVQWYRSPARMRAAGAWLARTLA
ncbi:lysin B [Gordonia phage BobBob]|nr:lysin B [Gordonia phage BobBob]